MLVPAPGVHEKAGIVGIAKEIVDRLEAEWQSGTRADAPGVHQAPHFRFGVSAGGELQPGFSEQAEQRLIWLVRPRLSLSVLSDSLVSERGIPRENALLELAAHTLDRPHCPNVVIELGEAGKDCLHELALGIGVNRFRDRNDLCAVFRQSCLDAKVVRDVSREAIDLPHEKSLYLPCVFSTEVN